jgi:hypothetical protein
MVGRILKKKFARKTYYHCKKSKVSSDSTVAKHSPHHPKVEGSSPAAAAGTRLRKWQESKAGPSGIYSPFQG